MRLIDGADAIRADLPASATKVVMVPLEAGDDLGTGVARCSAIAATFELAKETLAADDIWTVTIGGDCSAELAPIAHAVERLANDVAVVWFDAHADLGTREPSPAVTAFTPMVLRTLMGDGCAELSPSSALKPSQIILAGTRSLDAEESAFVSDNNIRTLSVTEIAHAEAVISAITATGASRVYLHVDLDVLDPDELGGINDPVPFGVTSAVLLRAISAITEKFDLAGAGVTSFAPSSPAQASDDLPTILRIIGALTAGHNLAH